MVEKGGWGGGGGDWDGECGWGEIGEEWVGFLFVLWWFVGEFGV